MLPVRVLGSNVLSVICLQMSGLKTKYEY